MNGTNNNGMTSAHITVNDDKKSIPPPRTIDKSDGAVIAIVKLHNREYVATLVMLPPNMLVMTGAAVAVGIKKHIKAPAAIVGLMLYKAIYIKMPPRM